MKSQPRYGPPRQRKTERQYIGRKFNERENPDFQRFIFLTGHTEEKM